MPSVEQAKSAWLDRQADIQATQDLTEDLRAKTRHLTIAFTAIATFFVLLRFFARYRQRAKIWYDDWLMLAALVFLFGNMVFNIVLIEQGMGLHSGALTLEQLQKLDKTLVGAEIIYVTGVNLYKLSLLFLYFRIFPVRSVRVGGYICGGLSTSWNVACFFAALFQCTPREKLWEPWLDGTCINLFLTQLCIAVPSILVDIAILCLPIPQVWKLNTNRTQRILLMIIFLLGSYVVFTSIYRFRIFLLYTTDDIPFSLAPGCAWNIVEISSGIVSACLPTLGPLMKTVFKSVMGSSHAGGSGPLKPASDPIGNDTIVTIGGSGAKKHSRRRGASGWASLGTRNDGTKLDDGLEHDLELVPRDKAGHVSVSVTVRGKTKPPSDGAVSDKPSAMEDEWPLTAIRQRTDVEWREERSSPGKGGRR